MTTAKLDFVTPIRALAVSRPAEYLETVLRLAKAESLPDAAELRLVADLLDDLGYPPERLQADISRVHDRERAVASLREAASMDKEAQEANQQHKQLNSDSLSHVDGTEAFRNLAEQSAIKRERAAFLIREAQEMRQWAQKDFQSTGGREGFKPLTDQEWSYYGATQADVDAEVARLTERSRPEAWARRF
jgi:hypothetical protein